MEKDSTQSALEESEQLPLFDLGSQLFHASRLLEKLDGQVNPEFAEWFMGWPMGWTALQPLAMDKFRQWLRSHGKH